MIENQKKQSTLIYQTQLPILPLMELQKEKLIMYTKRIVSND